MEAMKKLTPKQARFVEEYLVDLNATQAAIRAGYSETTARQIEPNSFPPLFTEALAWQLASMLAGPMLKGDAGAAEAKRCLQMVSVYLPQAKEVDANQYQLPITHKVVWMEQR